ncbi:MAG: AAA family ATPase [Caulobacteraceae bacterium]
MSRIVGPDLRFSSLQVANWRQFRDIDIVLHDRLTILTGSNGAGKSTILNIFAQHFGFSRPYLATPKRGKAGGFLYDMGLHRDLSSYFDEPDDLIDHENGEPEDPQGAPGGDKAPPPPFSGQMLKLGSIGYSNGVAAEILAPDQNVSQYGLAIQPQQPVPGIHVGSHRGQFAYQPVQAIVAQALMPQNAFAAYNQEVQIKFSGGNSVSSPTYRMKEALVSMAAFGEGNSSIQGNKEALEAFKSFVERLRLVLPPEIGFHDILIRLPDIVLKTASGDFILDSSSGGINAIIEITWQIHLFSLFQPSFVVTIDEPENHLHPSLQREIVPSLLKAFPEAQFIIATHSPFVVSAVEDSSVYVLNYTGMTPSSPNNKDLYGRRRVESLQLTNFQKAGTASEILREVLGVPVTVPDWATDKVARLIELYRGRDLTAETLAELRADLAQKGLSELYPDAVSEWVRSVDQIS